MVLGEGGGFRGLFCCSKKGRWIPSEGEEGQRNKSESRGGTTRAKTQSGPGEGSAPWGSSDDGSSSSTTSTHASSCATTAMNDTNQHAQSASTDSSSSGEEPLPGTPSAANGVERESVRLAQDGLREGEEGAQVRLSASGWVGEAGRD